jgi:predicted small secreted protein
MEQEMIRLTLAALALGLGASSLAACNTIHGVGRDLEAVGRTIADLPQGEKAKKRSPPARAASAPQTQAPHAAAQTAPPRAAAPTPPPARPPGS